jgi:hypothetical protein
MGNDFGIGFSVEPVTGSFQFCPKLLEILDNAIVHHRNAIRCMRMRVHLSRCAMGGPTRVANSDDPANRLILDQVFQIDEFPFGPTPVYVAVDQSGDSGGVVASIFEPLQCIDQVMRNRAVADDSNNAAHEQYAP